MTRNDSIACATGHPLLIPDDRHDMSHRFALRELPRGAVVFAVGALDAYLSDVSAEVMIFQCQQGLVTGDTRIAMKAVNQSLPGLALELAVTTDGGDRVDRLRAAIVEHFQTVVSGHGPEAVARTLERMGGRAADIWRALEERGFSEPARALDEWTTKRHSIVHRGQKVSVPWKQGRRCVELLGAVADEIDPLAMAATSLGSEAISSGGGPVDY